MAQVQVQPLVTACPKPCPPPCPPNPCPPPPCGQMPPPPCNEPVVCQKPCDKPCEKDWGWLMWLAGVVIWYIILLVLFWLIFYSLKPSWVLVDGTSVVDTSKVLLAAAVAALLLLIIIGLIVWLVSIWC